MVPVCPKCDVPLFILHFKDVEVDYCERCRGLWLDGGELEALFGLTRSDDPLFRFQQQPGILPSDGHRHLCPRCDEPLREIQVERLESQSLTLDKCPRGHGLWFDADELRQLLATFPPQSGAGKAIDHLNELFAMKPKPKQGDKP